MDNSISQQFKFKEAYGLYAWLFVSMLYWTNAVAVGQFAVGALSLVLVFIKFSTFKRLFLSLNEVFFISLVSFAIGAFINNYENIIIALFTLLHLYAIVIFSSQIKINISDKGLTYFIAIFLIINYASLCFVYGFGLLQWMVLDDSRGFLRYQFIFSEPSYLAIYAAILIYFSGTAISDKYIKYLLIILLFTLIYLSASASGMILSVIGLLLSSYKSNNGIRKNNLITTTVSAAIALILTSFAFDNDFIRSRLDTFSIEQDTAFFLRFIAPWMVVDNVISTHPITGSGFGFLNSYLLNNYANYDFMAKIDANNDYIENTNIDNIFAFVISSLGVPLAAFVLYKLYRISRIAGGLRRSIFIFSLSFFMGSFIGPLFFGIIYARVVNASKRTVKKPSWIKSDPNQITN